MYNNILGVVVQQFMCLIFFWLILVRNNVQNTVKKEYQQNTKRLQDQNTTTLILLKRYLLGNQLPTKVGEEHFDVSIYYISKIKSGFGLFTCQWGCTKTEIFL